MSDLLKVRDLRVEYGLGRGAPVAALRGVDFEMAAGESLGVLGESGSGKSTLAACIPGLLAPGAAMRSGSVLFRGRELVGLSDRQMRSVRGAEIGFIHQEPAVALNPVLRIGRQVADVARAHAQHNGTSASQQAVAMLERVGLPGPDFLRAYPHQLSGGQRQRVVIAQALVCRPALVIADEPTSSLDSTTQAEILALVKQLRQEFGISLLLVSQDPAVIAAVCDRVMVMYAGRIVEQGPASEVYCRPLHPYTSALLSLLADRVESGGRRLPSIPGNPPDMHTLPSGCSFAPRCGERMENCAAREPEEVVMGERRVRCFKHGG